MPTVYEVSERKKKKTVHKAVQESNWIKDIDIHAQISTQHLSEFISKCMELNDEIEDYITWKLTANGTYSTGSAYKAQFLGSTTTNYLSIIWKAWTPPKYKHFARLDIQNRLWTSAQLQHQGWLNIGNCTMWVITRNGTAPFYFI